LYIRGLNGLVATKLKSSIQPLTIFRATQVVTGGNQTQNV